MKNWIILVNRYKAIGQQYDKLLYNCHSVMLVCVLSTPLKVLLFQEATDSSVHAWVWKVLPNKYTGWAIVITFRTDECCSMICTWKPCRELVTNVACRTIAQSYGVQQKTDSLSKVSLHMEWKLRHRKLISVSPKFTSRHSTSQEHVQWTA